MIWRLPAFCLVCAVLALAPLLPGAARAGEAESRLLDAVAIDDLLAVMSAEGRDHVRDLGAEMALDSPEGLAALAERIYRPARMRRHFEDGFAGRMDPAEIAAATAFFTGPAGARIVQLEISARAAMLDPDVDALSRAMLAEARAGDTPRLALVRRFVEVNDLVESNVVGTLNAQYAFYMGLGEAENAPVSETDVLAELYAQQDAIRLESGEWLLAYLLMAYEPLSDADIEAYIAFSESAAGQAYNRAVFVAFDRLFVEISGRLGRGIARLSIGERL